LGLYATHKSAVASTITLLKSNIGFYINGQKTGLRDNKALNRINVMFAIIELAHTILPILKNYIFEYNDEDTRLSILKNLNVIKQDFLNNKAFYSIDFICDSTNNTNEIVNDNALVVATEVVPLKTAEKILFTLTLHEYGWTLNIG